MIIKNKILPPKGYSAIAIWPFIFTRKDEISERTINHEKIHFAQQKELLIIPFFILYGIFYLIYGYKKNPFEKEAYNNSDNFNYLKIRKLYSIIKYL